MKPILIGPRPFGFKLTPSTVNIVAPGVPGAYHLARKGGLLFGIGWTPNLRLELLLRLTHASYFDIYLAADLHAARELQAQLSSSASWPTSTMPQSQAPIVLNTSPLYLRRHDAVRARLLDFLNGLPEIQRRCAVEIYLENRTPQELAMEMSIPEELIAKYLRSVRDSIRKNENLALLIESLSDTPEDSDSRERGNQN